MTLMSRPCSLMLTSRNTSKTKVMIFSCKCTSPTLNLHVDSIAIIVASTTFRGVMVTTELKWNTHISSTCAKARQQLGFLYRFYYMADSSAYPIYTNALSYPPRITAVRFGTLLW